MIRHCVMLTWTEEANEETIKAVLAGLTELRPKIDVIRSYSFGPDLELDPGRNHDLMIVAEFDSVEDYQIYASHPDHIELIVQTIKPILATRAAVQYEVDPV